MKNFLKKYIEIIISVIILGLLFAAYGNPTAHPHLTRICEWCILIILVSIIAYFVIVVFLWELKKIPRKEKVCNHKNNYQDRKYLLADGTPMVEFECFDCGFRDRGHVYGDSEDWESITIVRDGHLIFHEKPTKNINHE